MTGIIISQNYLWSGYLSVICVWKHDVILVQICPPCMGLFLSFLLAATYSNVQTVVLVSCFSKTKLHRANRSAKNPMMLE